MWSRALATPSINLPFHLVRFVSVSNNRTVSFHFALFRISFRFACHLVWFGLVWFGLVLVWFGLV